MHALMVLVEPSVSGGMVEEALRPIADRNPIDSLVLLWPVEAGADPGEATRKASALRRELTERGIWIEEALPCVADLRKAVTNELNRSRWLYKAIVLCAADGSDHMELPEDFTARLRKRLRLPTISVTARPQAS